MKSSRPPIPTWLQPTSPSVDVLDANAAVVPRAAAQGNPGQGYFSQRALGVFNDRGGIFRYRNGPRPTPPTPKRRLSRSCIPQRLGRRMTLANWWWRCFLEGSVA